MIFIGIFIVAILAMCLIREFELNAIIAVVALFLVLLVGIMGTYSLHTVSNKTVAVSNVDSTRGVDTDSHYVTFTVDGKSRVLDTDSMYTNVQVGHDTLTTKCKVSSFIIIPWVNRDCYYILRIEAK